MRTRFIKYGKSIKNSDGTMEHIEFSIALDHGDYEEEAVHKAKELVRRHLAPKPLTGTIGEHLAAKSILPTPAPTKGQVI